MANVGDYINLNKVPLNAYGTASHAARRDLSWHVKTVESGQARILDKAWTDTNNNVYYPAKGNGTIPIYSVTQVGGYGALGWIRSDDLASASTFNRIEDFALNTTSKINMFLNIYMEGVTHHVEVLVGGTVVRTVSNVRFSPYSFRFTESDLNAIYHKLPNTSSGTAVFRVTTRMVSDNSQVGQPHSINVNFSIPIGVRPEINNVNITNVGMVFNQLYQNISSVNVSVDAEPGQGANITSTTIRVGNTTFTGTNYNAPIFTTFGDIPIVVNVTDSRGRMSTYATNVTVTEYIGVQMTAFNATRVLNANGETDYVVIATMGVAGRINNNQIFARYQYKERSATNWREGGTENIPTINNAFAGTYQISDLSDTVSYDIKVMLMDGLNQQFEFITTLGTASYPMMWGKHGASFGRNFDNSLPQHVQIGQSGLVIGDTILTESDLIALKNLL